VDEAQPQVAGQPEGTAVLGQKIATWPCQGEVAREGNKSLAD
jgi:hypothetical protein